MMIIVKERMLCREALPSVDEYFADGVKKVIVIDYDGVIHPESANYPPRGWFRLSRSREGRYPNKYYNAEQNSRLHRYDREPKSFLIRWSDELVEKINSISNLPDVLIVWLTTWRGDMAGVCEMIGITSARPMVYLKWGDDVRGENHSLKIPALKLFLNGSSGSFDSDLKLVCADDKALDGLTSDDDIFSRFTHGNVLLLKPNEKYGLSHAEITAMIDFCNTLTFEMKENEI